MKSLKSVNWFLVSAVIAILLIIGMTWFDTAHPMQCVKTAKVKEILSLSYRDANIRLDTGEIVRVNQASLAPGDDFCTKWERK